MLKLLALATILCTFIACGSKKPSPPDDILSLPTIRYLSTDSTFKSIDHLENKNESVVIMYFESDCEHCMAETSSVLKHIDEINGTKIFMLSQEPLDKIKLHKSRYGITDDMPLKLGKDVDRSFINIMKVKSIPSTIVYNSDHKIIKFFNGEVLWPQIQMALNNDKQL